MKYCSNCGKEIDDKAVVCIHCGVAVETKTEPATSDSGGAGWTLLGCCLPLVGLILFLVWNDKKPKNAKAAGMGALIGVILTVLYYFFVGLAGVGMGL
ncbi:MAG: zinc ribbon domain-containing protein [Selenomonadales bacterium]|nr:zinc ribbon domain-containing protein [Clostridia bacterium]MBQ6713023.1 zinc ribbon domain-containing protein [Selenomonadales bacterium]